MNNLKQFASTAKVETVTLRSFSDWIIQWTSRGNEPRVVITYCKNRKPNREVLFSLNSEIEQLHSSLNHEEDISAIRSIRNRIANLETQVDIESRSIQKMSCKCVVNEEDLLRFLQLIDQSGEIEVYKALKATGLRYNEFINEEVINPSSQWIEEYDYETWATLQRWTREYTWKKRDE